MFGQIPEMMSNEVQYRQDQYREEAARDRRANQANRTREARRSRRFDVLLGVKRGKLSIEEGLNLLENV